MLPTVFKDPASYEPERFLPPREEDKVKPFSYVGFGGGRHACIGQNFAYLQVSLAGSALPLCPLRFATCARAFGPLRVTPVQS